MSTTYCLVNTVDVDCLVLVALAESGDVDVDNVFMSEMAALAAANS